MALQTSRNRRSSLPQLQRTLPVITLQRLVGVKRGDCLLQAIAADEPHRVIGAAIPVGSQPVYRYDPRVLQSARDLGLHDESLADDGIVGVGIENLLQRHLSVKLAIQRHEHRPEAAACVRPQHAESLTIACGRLHGVGRGAVSAPVRSGADPAQCGFDGGVSNSGEALSRRGTDGQRGEAFFGFAAIAFKVLRGERLEQGSIVGVERLPERRGSRRSAGTCRGSRPETRRRASPGRSSRSEVRAVQREGRWKRRRPSGDSGGKASPRLGWPRNRGTGGGAS